MKALCATAVIAVCVVVLADRACPQAWVEITPATGPSPSPRTLSSAIYDPVAHAMVIFGGQDGAGVRLNDVWSFDLATETWTEVTPTSGGAPVGRITPSSVYDADNHQMLMFSGQGSGALFLNDTWGFDLTTNTWSQFNPPNPIPSTRYGVATCYDVDGKRQVTFAGFTFQGRFDDTWSFDPVSGTWTDVSPASGGPIERCLHVACYDAEKGRMIMYGGQNAGPLGDIWAFDLATGTWTELTPTFSPDPRWFATMQYDHANNRATMFSGNRHTLGKANDVWVFDLLSNWWTELTPSGTPPVARDGASSVFVAAEDRMVIFGGSAGGMLADVWSLNNLSDTPTGVPPPLSDGAARAVLYQNQPNPFNPITAIEYEIASPASVLLAVFDVTGKRIRTLVDGAKAAGPHRVSWDGRNDAGANVSSGVYLYRLRAGGEVRGKKMLLLK